ncbi:MAG: hypothetical protein HRT71_17080 [Flavobacteriales bacterium]|nr:hypothetical protein [Flavobacteriales bacterium]
MLILPEQHSLNDMLLNYGSEAILEWTKETCLQELQRETQEDKLIVKNPQLLEYKGRGATYEVVGKLQNDLSKLKATTFIIHPDTGRKYRYTIDYYDNHNISMHCKELSEKENLNENLLETDLSRLTELLEQRRNNKLEESMNNLVVEDLSHELTANTERKAIQFLSEPNLLKSINTMLGKSGIVGEEENRIAMFILASTYKTAHPLHGLIQGASSSGKTHLIEAVSKCMPSEDVMSFNRISSKSLYYFQEGDLINKLFVVQDLDGMDGDALYSLREIQSAGVLTSSTPVQDALGNRRTTMNKVSASFASLMATTKAEIYYDNMTRSVPIGVDESEEQTSRIIQHQNRKRAGKIDSDEEFKAKQALRNCIRVLRDYEVVNPYAESILLPVEARMQRRLNGQFQDFIAQITILNQFQRKKDERGRLIVALDDVIQGIEIFFNSIWLKVDELDASTRQFFESLKDFIKENGEGNSYKFTARELRENLNVAKGTVFNQLKVLQQLEYIQIASGSPNRGFKYMVSHWDESSRAKEAIKDKMVQQVKTLNEH